MTVSDERVELGAAGRALVATSQPPTRVGSFSFSNDLVVLSDPRGPRAEAIRGIRTFLLGQHVHKGRRALAVCAASAGIGTTFVAANVAVALAQVGVKVLLVDGDVRNGSLQSMIRPSEPPSGLVEALRRGGSFHDYVQPDVVTNLSVMYSGGPSADAQELLAAERFHDLLERCMRDYDITILDTPPANASADARRLCAVAGYALVVAKRHETFVSDLTTLAEQLAQEHTIVVGTILNDG